MIRVNLCKGVLHVKFAVNWEYVLKMYVRGFKDKIFSGILRFLLGNPTSLPHLRVSLINL